MNSQSIIHFWFTELTPKDWWKKDDALDQSIKEQFGDIHHSASTLELQHWRTSAKGRLAEIIILDQFSRNIYRDTPAAFASDNTALALAQEAVSLGADQKLSAVEKSFLYLPYMHSESLVIHEAAIVLFSQDGLEHNLEFEHKHQQIIARFGRYPHRNKILERESTEEEIEFLKTKGSSF